MVSPTTMGRWIEQCLNSVGDGEMGRLIEQCGKLGDGEMDSTVWEMGIWFEMER